LEDLVIDGRIILKWLLLRQNYPVVLVNH
jgi:hypothetical protein